MNLQDYQKQAHATARYDDGTALHYLIPALVTEILELKYTMSDEELISEAGDCLWFCAEILTQFDADMSAYITDADLRTFPDPEVYIEWLLKLGRNILDAWVKAVRDNDAVLTPEKQESIRVWLSSVIHFLDGLVGFFGYTLEEIAQKNADKLADRAERGVIRGSGDKR